jgi:hypothetical protein
MSYAANDAPNGINTNRFEGLEPSVSASGVLAATTNFFPRSCIDRTRVVNADFNFVPYSNPALASSCANVYFSGYVSTNADASYPLQMTNANALTGGAISSLPVFPYLPTSTTPSVNVYMR